MKFNLAGGSTAWTKSTSMRNLGHDVDCRWLKGLHQIHPGSANVDNADSSVPMEAAAFAQEDVEDLAASHAIILFSERPDSHSKRGGRHVEFGMALAWGKRLFVIGPRENVFHCLPGVMAFPAWRSFLAYLSKETRA